VDAVTLIMYRMLFALPLFVLMAWWSSRNKPPLTRKDIGGILGLGFTGYYIASYLDFWGLSYISASLERLILYLNPTLVLLWGWGVYQRRIQRLVYGRAGGDGHDGHRTYWRGLDGSNRNGRPHVDYPHGRSGVGGALHRLGCRRNCAGDCRYLCF
jgi:EamA-like transporter family